MATTHKLFFLFCVLVHCFGDAQVPEAQNETTTPPTTTPPTNTTTTPPTTTPTTNTTTAPPTTTPPTNTTTTAPPTTAPPTNTTTAPPTTTSQSTITGATAPSTLTSIKPDDTSPTSTVVTAPPDPCQGNTCGSGSTCVPLSTGYTCTCLAGQSYNEALRTCENAKVFPGELQVASITYEEQMSNQNSPQFQKASKTITDKLDISFKNKMGYEQSIVLKIEAQKAKTLARQTGIIASVDIIFKANAAVTSEDVKNTAQDGSAGVTFTETSLCERQPCDTQSTQCKSSEGAFTCTCLDGYIKTGFSERSCSLCPSGTKAENSQCVSCPFGYSGLNCAESWKLALVITGCVLGALLLIVTAMLPVIALKSKRSKKSKESKFENPQMSQSTKTPAGGANGWMPRIPRAGPTSSWDRGTNLEMAQSSSQQNLIPGGKNSRLYEEINDKSGSPYGQNRPQYNPYGQNRATTNPYAQSRGQANPYYRDDNDRLN